MSGRSAAAAPRVVIANDLREGDVVYRAAGGGWTRRLAEAQIASSDAEAEALLAGALAAGGEVVGPELAALDPTTPADAPDAARFAHLRDAIRAEGPTTHPVFGRSTGR